MKKNLKIMYLMGILAFLSFTIFISNIFDDLDYNSRNRLENSGFWHLTSDPIYINDLNPSINWSKTAADNDWCSGSGTWSDPYLIENITIDGLFSGSCIWIENSNVPFILRNCTFINNGRGASGWDSGIRFNNASNGYIENINISLNEFRGISVLDSSNNNTFTHNIINNNDYVGLYLGYSSNNNTFHENTFNYNNDGGFNIYHCNFNNFSGNSITQAMSDWTREISITGKNNTFSGNIFENCGISLQPYDEPLSELTSHLIDTTNLVNGRPIYYYAKKQFLTKDNFANAGQILLVNCEYCEISRVNISNGGRGILLYYSHNNTIYNNSISNSYAEEILVYKSHQNNISYNLINNLDSSRGIYLRYSNKNNVTFNRIIDCNTAIEVGTSFNNTISDNYLDNNYRGMYIQNGQIVDMYNIVMRNIISNNSEGIYTTSPYTTNNTIYLNNFINNGVNAENNGGSNNWDNGSIGNYWDDYVGNDTNDDGIGETPRLIPGTAGDQDNFPLWDDGHNGSKIFIDDSSSNNWKWASKFTWCSGSGTESDPYIIFKVNINGGNTGNGIYIRNSNMHFRIENSTVYNCEADSTMYGGIKLENVDNGVLIFNNCSNNNGNAILLDDCNNITIKENVMNNNGITGGTLLGSHYNILVNNGIYNNERAFWLSNSYNNEILKNTLVNNYDQSIRLSQAYFNKIKGNSITGGYMGIRITGYNNTVSENDLFSNTYGIYLADGMWTENNTVANNTIHDNSNGIHLDGANCRYNTFYNNTLMNNGLNAFDDGYSDYFDNGIIGNYWDDYGGEDADDDGIGESPYLITGLADSQDNFPIWYDGHNGSKIVIDDDSWNNWTWAETQEWCSGSGTFNDPYIIKDLVINGKNASSCILIKNSNLFFRIENCTVFNSSSGLGNAGIKLDHSNNGTLIDNNCSNNNGNGIHLTNSQNITISGNTANNNVENGITLVVSHNNNISGNTLNENSNGVSLGISNNNTISENSVFNNDWRGIYLTNDNINNTIINNNLSYNKEGILASTSHNNTVIGNNAEHNEYGIWVWKSNNSIIIGNTVSYNDLIGLRLYNSSNTLVYNNVIHENTLNAEDNRINNQWDNGVFGNDWSDYNGKDADDNGIGDTPYIIAGTAGSQDNLPVWWDAPLFSIASPLMNEEFNNNAPSHEISIIEGIADTMWYTLDNGLTNQTFLSLTGVINQALWDDVPLGIVILRFTVNDSRGYSSSQEINILKILDYLNLSPFIIDDTGGGDYTWAEAVQERWCQGSGTSIDPYTIGFIKIDGQNSSSCLTIRFSQVYFTIVNCTFYNSGNNDDDAGVKLINTTNGRLHLVNSSFNNGHGILLEFCEYINITKSSFNHNNLNGILLINSNYINILDNTDTIDYNDDYGIYLINSHNNIITGNTINNNRVGIYLDQSNSNYIDWNNLLGNGEGVVDNGLNNIIGANNILPSIPPEFPFEILIIMLIIGIVAAGVTGAAVLVKKRISKLKTMEREISEKKKEKVKIKLEAKLDVVNTLIRENNFKLAYKNSRKVKDTAEQYEFFDIFNKANKKIEICKEEELGISVRAIEEGIAPSFEKGEPVIGKKAEFKYNIFISYSTSDRDYFQIKKVVKELKNYPIINQISYWERDSKANIVEFMDKTLEVSNTFILFCSENSFKSNAVKDEWQAAFQMRKQGLIKLIPVYEEQEHIPKLLWHLLNVKYNQEDFKGFIENLYKEIIRG